MRRASGVLIRADDSGRTLLLRRPEGSWDTPGGMTERGEGPVEGMLRELREETGFTGDLEESWPAVTIYRLSSGAHAVHRSQGAVLAYTLFFAAVDRQFRVRLDEEHDSAEWVFLDRVPRENLHPGLELGVLYAPR